MISVYGKIRELHEADDRCPKDGVHRSKPDGTIRHPRFAMLAGKPLFYGNEGMYVESLGMKVYYALRLGTAWSLEQVEYVKRKMAEFQPFAVFPGDIEQVDLDVKFRGLWTNRKAWGLHVQKVNYPLSAWKRYCRGHAYDWQAIDHPDHSPAGFLAFVEKAKPYVPELHIKSLTLGNVAWDFPSQRWWIMDVDWRGPEHMR